MPQIPCFIHYAVQIPLIVPAGLPCRRCGRKIDVAQLALSTWTLATTSCFVHVAEMMLQLTDGCLSYYFAFFRTYMCKYIIYSYSHTSYDISAILHFRDGFCVFFADVFSFCQHLLASHSLNDIFAGARHFSIVHTVHVERIILFLLEKIADDSLDRSHSRFP